MIGWCSAEMYSNPMNITFMEDDDWHILLILYTCNCIMMLEYTFALRVHIRSKKPGESGGSHGITLGH